MSDLGGNGKEMTSLTSKTDGWGMALLQLLAASIGQLYHQTVDKSTIPEWSRFDFAFGDQRFIVHVEALKPKKKGEIYDASSL